MGAHLRNSKFADLHRTERAYTQKRTRTLHMWESSGQAREAVPETRLWIALFDRANERNALWQTYQQVGEDVVSRLAQDRYAFGGGGRSGRCSFLYAPDVHTHGSLIFGSDPPGKPDAIAEYSLILLEQSGLCVRFTVQRPAETLKF